MAAVPGFSETGTPGSWPHMPPVTPPASGMSSLMPAPMPSMAMPGVASQGMRQPPNMVMQQPPGMVMQQPGMMMQQPRMMQQPGMMIQQTGTIMQQRGTMMSNMMQPGMVMPQMMMPQMVMPQISQQAANSSAKAGPAAKKEPVAEDHKQPPKHKKSGADVLKLAEDPDVKELCNHFNIDDANRMRLALNLTRRPETFETDMLKLWDLLTESKYDHNKRIVGCLNDMDKGIFVTQGTKPDKELKDFIKMHDLDQIATRRLTDSLHFRGAKIDDEEGRREDRSKVLKNLDYEVAGSRNASQLIMKRLRDIETGEDIVPGKGARPMREIEARDRKSRSRSRGRGTRRSLNRRRSKSR